MYYIGIDLGTSAVKLILVDENGEIKNTVSREYPLEFPRPGWSQQDPNLWLEGTFIGLEKLLEGFDKSALAGIGIGGQMHGLVVLDSADKVIRPAILWNDGRTEQETKWLNECIGKEKLSKYTGNIAFGGFTAPKLLWMQHKEPVEFARISKIMLPKDYLIYNLTGVHCCEPSDASGTLFFDVENRCWSKEMIHICGISESMLPKIFASSEKVGNLKPEICDRFGLPKAVTVCAGAGDNAAAAVGCGVIDEGTCNISLGTSGTVFIPSNKFNIDPNNALHSFVHANNAWHQMGCILSAASCNKWWMDILKADDYIAEQSGIEDRLGTNNIYYLPYLMGERSPHNDINARSAFVGMSMDSTRADMTQAVLEGVSFAIRDCFESARKQNINITSSMLCGGGAKSPLWRKMLANILNIPLSIPQTEQGPSYGAAMLAAVSTGQFANVRECADSWVKIKETVVPDAAIVKKYELKYQHWRQLYPALKNHF